MSSIPENIGRIIYLGTPEIAVAPLRDLHLAGLEIPLVVTGKDKRRGRGSEESPSPVKQEAQKLGLSITHNLEEVMAVEADLGVVVAYGELISEEILNSLPMVNMHFSLLPRWRGAAPVERAILSGDELTGVCIMQIEKELDTGPTFRRSAIPILGTDMLGDLKLKLSDEGRSLLLDCVLNGFGAATPQIGKSSYAKKIQPDELQIDWEQSTEQICRLIRLEKAWTTVKGNRLSILEARIADLKDLLPGQVQGTVVGAGDGSVELLSVKPAGGRRIQGKDWVNGLHLDAKDRLGG